MTEFNPKKYNRANQLKKGTQLSQEEWKARDVKLENSAKQLKKISKFLWYTMIWSIYLFLFFRINYYLWISMAKDKYLSILMIVIFNYWYVLPVIFSYLFGGTWSKWGWDWGTSDENDKKNH